MRRAGSRFANNLDYLSGMDRPDGFARLKSRLEEIERKRGLPPNRIYYLSVPPEAITETVAKLHGAGLIAPLRVSAFHPYRGREADRSRPA